MAGNTFGALFKITTWNESHGTGFGAVIIGGRHDISAIPRIVPICEAMVRLTLVDHLLRQQALLACCMWDSSNFTGQEL